MSAVAPPTPVPVDPAVPSEPEMPKPPTTKPRSRKAPKTAGISQADKVKAFYKKRRGDDKYHYQKDSSYSLVLKLAKPANYSAVC